LGADGGSANFFDGDFDRVALYDHLLTPAEVAAICTGDPLLHMYDFSDTDNITGSPTVTAVTDIGGQDNLTAFGNPQTGSRTQNALNTIDFDGTGDYLQGAFTAGGSISQPFTVFFVFKIDTAVSGDRFFDGDDGTNTVAFHCLGVNFALNAGTQQTFGSAGTTTWHMLVAEINGASSAAWIDGSTATLGGTLGANAIDGLTIAADNAGTNDFDGAVGEHRIYEGVLADRETIETAILLKWDIAQGTELSEEYAITSPLIDHLTSSLLSTLMGGVDTGGGGSVNQSGWDSGFDTGYV
jgi:hypothetical protein